MDWYELYFIRKSHCVTCLNLVNLNLVNLLIILFIMIVFRCVWQKIKVKKSISNQSNLLTSISDFVPDVTGLCKRPIITQV